MKTNKKANFKLSFKKHTIASLKEQEAIIGGIVAHTAANTDCKVSCRIKCKDTSFK